MSRRDEAEEEGRGLPLDQGDRDLEDRGVVTPPRPGPSEPDHRCCGHALPALPAH